MLRLLAQQGLQYFFGFFLFVQNDVQLGQIEVRLIKVGRDLDARLELLLRFRIVRLAHEENAQIIQRFGIIRAQRDGLAEIIGRAIKLVLAGVEHADTVIRLRIIGRGVESLLEELLCVGQISFSTQQIPEVQERGDIGWPELDGALKILDGFVFLALLRGNHAEIVPGFSIVGAQLNRLFEITARVWQRVSPKVERPQVVVGDWVVGLCENHLLELCRGLFEITALEHRYAIGEIVALELVLKESAFHGQRFLEESSGSIGNLTARRP